MKASRSAGNAFAPDNYFGIAFLASILSASAHAKHRTHTVVHLSAIRTTSSVARSLMGVVEVSVFYRDGSAATERT